MADDLNRWHNNYDKIIKEALDTKTREQTVLNKISNPYLKS